MNTLKLIIFIIKFTMKTREICMLVGLSALGAKKLLQLPLFSLLIYSIVSRWLAYDHNIIPITNHHGEIEDKVFKHSFINVTKSSSGIAIGNSSFHVVECGSSKSEPILFYHGFAENWRVWKSVMQPFCRNYRAIAIDLQGHGQTSLDLENLQVKDFRGFMSDIHLQLLTQLQVNKFNLVTIGYGFWTTLGMLNSNRVLRYLKLQSPVGVEDVERWNIFKWFFKFPVVIDYILSIHTSALPRVIFGSPRIKLPALSAYSRVGSVEISDELIQLTILSSLNPDIYKIFMASLTNGMDLIDQVSEQRNLFAQVKFPVLMIQGSQDVLMPMKLFDGSLRNDIVKGKDSRILVTNSTHILRQKYFRNETKPISPLPHHFFPNASYVEFEVLSEVGGYLHLEATEKVISNLQKLLAVQIKNR